jgi:hypothetical protein
MEFAGIAAAGKSPAFFSLTIHAANLAFRAGAIAGS